MILKRNPFFLATLAAFQTGCLNQTPPLIQPTGSASTAQARPWTGPTPVPEDLRSGGPIAVTLAPREVKVWALSLIPGQDYLLTFNLPKDVGVAYFGQNSDIVSDSGVAELKPVGNGRYEILFRAQGSSYYLALGSSNLSESVFGTVLQLKDLSSPSASPVPVPTPEPSPLPTPSPTPSLPPRYSTDPSLPLKVQLTEIPPEGNSATPSRTYQLRFAEPVDPDSLTDSLCLWARSPLPMTVEGGGPGLFTAQAGRLLYRLSDFQSRWNSEKTELTLRFKPGRALLTDSNSTRQPNHSLGLDCSPTGSGLKDGLGRPRNYGFANENAQSLPLRITLLAPPVMAPLQWLLAEVRPLGDLRLRANRPLFWLTQAGVISGGLNGNATEAFAGPSPAPVPAAARNYTLTLERNGRTVLKAANWGALGGSVQFDPFDSDQQTLLLKHPPALAEPLSGVFAQGSEARTFPGPFFTDDADGNGESLELEMINRGWQSVLLTINLGENLKNASEVAQDLQNKANDALQALPSYQRAPEARFTVQRETNDVLVISFDDPSGLYEGYRIRRAFLSSSSQPLPNRLQNAEQGQTLPAGVLPPIFQSGDLFSLTLAESLRLPSGETLPAPVRNLNGLVKP